MQASEHEGFEEVLKDVWRQSLVQSAKSVALESGIYPVVRTSKRRLCQVDFKFNGKEIRGLEQNPDTSRWAAMARDGSKVMQFLVEGRYIAVVADGDVKVYAAA